MSSETHTHRTSRTKRACDSCKTSKLRCNGVLPCMRCVRRGVECKYNARYTRGRPPTPLSDSNVQSPQSIVPYTSTRTNTIQSLLSNTAHSPQENPSQPPTNVEPSLLNSSRSSVDLQDVQRETQYLGSTSGVSFLRRTWRRLKQLGSQAPDSIAYQASPYTATPKVHNGDALDWLQHVKFPDAKVGEAWVRTYFNLAMPTYRLFHEPTVMSNWIPEIYDDENGRSLKERLSKIPPGRMAVVLMMFATTSLYTTEQCDGTASTGSTFGEEAEPYFDAAQQQLSREGGHPTLESVQARIQQCIYLLSASRAIEAACIFGTTIQMALSLGLHRKKVPGSHSFDAIYTQSRKRTFLALYTIDRYISVILDRPFMIREDDFDQDTPDRINDADLVSTGPKKSPTMSDCLMDAPILHAEVATVIGHISRDIYSILPRSNDERLLAVDRHLHTLHTWKKNLPPIFQIHSSSLTTLFKRQSNVLQLAYSHAIIYATRAFLLTSSAPPTANDFLNTSNQTSQRQLFISEGCTAALAVTRIVHGFVQDNFNLQAFWYTQYTAFCAVMFLYIYCMQTEANAQHEQQKQQEEYMEVAERCQMELTSATDRNPSAQRYSIILEELRLEVRRQMKNPLRTRQPALAAANLSRRDTTEVRDSDMIGESDKSGGGEMQGGVNNINTNNLCDPSEEFRGCQALGEGVVGGEGLRMLPISLSDSAAATGAIRWQDDGVDIDQMTDFSMGWMELDSLASLNYPFNDFSYFQ